MEDDVGYYATEAGQFIANAHRYLSAAKLLTERDNWQSNHKVPALHLLCHGIELFLKYPLLRSGATQSELVKAYGHDLQKLWDAHGNSVSRTYILDTAVNMWTFARDSGEWHGDFTGDPRTKLIDGVRSMSFLHGKQSSFALRYTFSSPLPSQWPRFLIETFGDVAERTCMNPSYLDY